jgi:hypothetical protein
MQFKFKQKKSCKINFTIQSKVTYFCNLLNKCNTTFVLIPISTNNYLCLFTFSILSSHYSNLYCTATKHLL